jgi:hypothetical protein
VAQARLDAETLVAQAVAEAQDAAVASGREIRAAAEQRAREIEREADRTRSDDVAAVVAVVRSSALQPRDAEVAR